MHNANDTVWLGVADSIPRDAEPTMPCGVDELPPPTRPERAWEWRDRSYLGSGGAAAACTRELARLADGVVQGAKALALIDDASVEVRVLPDHCIAQLGDFAVTFKWLRHALHTTAQGELLVMGWRGRVGPRAQGAPERPNAAHVPRATLLWEETFTAIATKEADWCWHAGDAGASITSATLADHVVARLRDTRGGGSDGGVT